MDAFSRHRKLCNDYMLYYAKGKSIQDVFKRDTSTDKRDLDVIREEMKFIWEDGDGNEDTWEKRLAKKYYDKLFKEYCICDLTFYKMNKVAMRWRIEKEVVDGKGQFVCGEKRCPVKEDLKSWEVNFAYVEHGERKNALVKLRLCPDCSYKLNYHHKKKEIKKEKKSLTEAAAATAVSEVATPPLKKIKTEKEDKGYEKTTGDKKKNEEKVAATATAAAKSSSEIIDEENNMIILTDESVWKKTDTTVEEKSREEEFEDYLEDLLL